MMYSCNRLFFIGFIWLISTCLSAQEVISASGSNSLDGTLSCTIGQIFYHHVESEMQSLCEGVQQVDKADLILSTSSVLHYVQNVHVAPNPFQSEFRLLYIEEEVGVCSAAIFDINGYKLREWAFLPAQEPINTDMFYPGVYVLVIKSNSGYTKTIKLVKM